MPLQAVRGWHLTAPGQLSNAFAARMRSQPAGGTVLAERRKGNPMSLKLTEISVSGYKTIEQLERFELRSLNVLIGINAAGKSNFISFFRFLQWMLTPPGQLQLYVRENGGASSFLHYGPDRTQQITSHLELVTEAGINEYAFRLFYTAGDALAFAEERYRYSWLDSPSRAPWTTLQPALLEAGLNAKAESGDKTAKTINRLIRRCIVHQFHNTSRTSRIKQRWDTDDGSYLKEDAANLGPFLLRLQDDEPKAYARIVETVRLVYPLFADFELNRTGNTTMLQWREKGTDVVFSAHQASDGLLRFFALSALLLQPAETMPDVLFIDEPELGLHPHALEVLAGLLRKVSVQSQVVVATQSSPLVSLFEPEDIVVVERREGASQFRRLEADELATWLEEYTLGELWQKNYIQGASNG